MAKSKKRSKNQHCKLYTKKQFENILPIANRSAAILAQKKVLKKFKSKINYNFFSAPHLYNKTYQEYLKCSYDHLNLGGDLSLPAMDVIYYLGMKKIKNLKLLDYGCGISGIILYAQKHGDVKGYDNFDQITKGAIKYFYENLKIDFKTKLVNVKNVIKWRPNVMSVSNIWVSKIELYKLDSIKILLSDRLYNSGGVKKQGIFHYKPDWSDRPENFGFSLRERLPIIDVYTR